MTMMTLQGGPVGQEVLQRFRLAFLPFFLLPPPPRPPTISRFYTFIQSCRLDIFGKRASNQHNKGFPQGHLEGS